MRRALLLLALVHSSCACASAPSLADISSGFDRVRAAAPQLCSVAQQSPACAQLELDLAGAAVAVAKAKASGSDADLAVAAIWVARVEREVASLAAAR